MSATMSMPRHVLDVGVEPPRLGLTRRSPSSAGGRPPAPAARSPPWSRSFDIGGLGYPKLRRAAAASTTLRVEVLLGECSRGAGSGGRSRPTPRSSAAAAPSRSSKVSRPSPDRVQLREPGVLRHHRPAAGEVADAAIADPAAAALRRTCSWRSSAPPSSAARSRGRPTGRPPPRAGSASCQPFERSSSRSAGLGLVDVERHLEAAPACARGRLGEAAELVHAQPVGDALVLDRREGPAPARHGGEAAPPGRRRLRRPLARARRAAAS